MNKKFLINKYISFPSLLKFLPDSDYHYNYNGKIYCPFHYNVNTPAAKLFKDEGGDTLYCYSEQRLYRPYDLLDRGLIPYSVDDVFNFLSSKIDINEVESVIYNSKKDSLYRQEFMLGKMNIGDYIDFILDVRGYKDGS